jgi:hypothetical protein
MVDRFVEALLISFIIDVMHILCRYLWRRWVEKMNV